ncbi:MAG: Rieske (2Fe-2S) protein [Fimbriimonadaceae bacterium]|nr:Rieske (2Fe-2S) protein [Fimbriimonadaceae bacterium]
MPEPQWHTVATTAELPAGGRKLVSIEGKSIGLFNVHGEIVAVLDVCPHELAPVCRGRVSGTTLPSAPGEYCWGREGEILACPWHGWEFDLTTGRCLVDEKLRLRRYPVEVVGDEVRVAL